MTSHKNEGGFEPHLPPPPSSSQPSVSSPPSNGRPGRKEKRNPSITPRKFTKFFTPRTARVNTRRHALYDITPPANNRNGVQSSPIRPFKSINGQENSPTGFTRELKRRKLLHINESSPDHLNADKKLQDVEFTSNHGSDVRDENFSDLPSSPPVSMASIMEEEEEEPLQRVKKASKRVVPLEARDFAGRFMQLSLGSTASSRRERYTYPVNGQ